MAESTQVTRYGPGRPRKGTEPVIPFIRLYYDHTKPKTYMNISATARAIGVGKGTGLDILKRVKKSGKLKEILEQVGLNEYVWAMNLADTVNDRVQYKDGSTHTTAQSVEGLKILGKALGTIIPDAVQVQQITQNISGGPVMIVVGASDQRFKQLEAGALEAEVVDEPQLPPARLPEIVEQGEGVEVFCEHGERIDAADANHV